LNPDFAWPLDTVDVITNSLRTFIATALVLSAIKQLENAPGLPSFEELSLGDLIVILQVGCFFCKLVAEIGFPLLILGTIALVLVLGWIAYKAIQGVACGIAQCARIPSWLWRQWSRFQGSFPKMWFRLDRV
jgi:hypothetical protein